MLGNDDDSQSTASDRATAAWDSPRVNPVPRPDAGTGSPSRRAATKPQAFHFAERKASPLIHRNR
jgi:hypothetical protein